MTTYAFRNQGKLIQCFGMVFAWTLIVFLIHDYYESDILSLGPVLFTGILFLASILGKIGRKVDIYEKRGGRYD